jgi:hypothetical protein
MSQKNKMIFKKVISYKNNSFSSKIINNNENINLNNYLYTNPNHEISKKIVYLKKLKLIEIKEINYTFLKLNLINKSVDNELKKIKKIRKTLMENLL